jgi:hypothetical protein
LPLLWKTENYSISYSTELPYDSAIPFLDICGNQDLNEILALLCFGSIHNYQDVKTTISVWMDKENVCIYNEIYYSVLKRKFCYM